MPLPGITCCGLRLTWYGTPVRPARSESGVIESAVRVPATKVVAAAVPVSIATPLVVRVVIV